MKHITEDEMQKMAEEKHPDSKSKTNDIIVPNHSYRRFAYLEGLRDMQSLLSKQGGMRGLIPCSLEEATHLIPNSDNEKIPMKWSTTPSSPTLDETPLATWDIAVDPRVKQKLDTEEKEVEFAEWASDEGWSYNPDKKLWCNWQYPTMITSSDLYQLFKNI